MEIKIRAWDIKGNQFWGESEGDWKIEFYDGEKPKLSIADYECEFGSWIEIEDAVFQLASGIEDRNGGEIYVGDIVEFYDFWDELTGGNMEGSTRIGAVENVGAGFSVLCPGGYEENLFLLKANDNELNIIGNIFEDKELLEENK